MHATPRRGLAEARMCDAPAGVVVRAGARLEECWAGGEAILVRSVWSLRAARSSRPRRRSSLSDREHLCGYALVVVPTGVEVLHDGVRHGGGQRASGFA